MGKRDFSGINREEMGIFEIKLEEESPGDKPAGADGGEDMREEGKCHLYRGEILYMV